ncbi:hypothetical protein [Cytobacillus firmus]|uniref:Uncharacterized protein n=1 Tax=Cytobacillus firmus TaxID=1399 RepID=A0AA46P789_CYTFI|nr:hypothetical protein [Cytobacillus firmus]UYG96739.1 hypothetical protein OD459_06835 [Cytobacillus firmus]
MKDFPSKRDFFYIVGFLVIAIIFIVSGRLSDNTSVVDYVGFAGTIVSILLAVIAIIYSFYQSSTYENSTQKLEITAKKIEQITNELSEVAEISGNIKYLKDTVDKINNIVVKIEANLYEDINQKPQQDIFNNTKANTGNGYNYDENFFGNVASNLTVLAAIVVVWIQKSHKKNVPFNIKDCTRYFIEDIMFERESNVRFIGIENAINGLLIAYEHLFFFKLTKLNENEFKVEEFDKHFANVIEGGNHNLNLLNKHFEDIERILTIKK